MLGESSILLGTIVGSCLVSVVLGWTSAIYYSDRRKWRRLEIILVALLLEASLRSMTVAAKSGLRLFRPAPEIYCGLVLWLGAAIHCLQAASLATLALGSALLARKPSLLTGLHMGYHLTSMALLSSCVGLAAVLSRPDACQPSLVDPRYTLFSLTLHISLVLLCLIGLILSTCQPKLRSVPSTSDLTSELSTSSGDQLRARHYLVAQLSLGKVVDPTYMSTTSSTNSRACLNKPKPIPHIPASTIVSVSIISLASNHLPVLITTIGSTFFSTVWTFEEVPEWGAVLEGLLLPLILAICDKAFLDRVATVHTRASPYDMARQSQGMYGKFRRVGGSINQHESPPIRFPITNGSLFTNFEGRGLLLRQQNYRRVVPGVLNQHPHQMNSVDQLRAFLGSREELDEAGIYATLSSVTSVCSATTSANEDFHFFHDLSHKQELKPERPKLGLVESRRDSEDILSPVSKSASFSEDRIRSRSEAQPQVPTPGRLVPTLSVDSLIAVLTKPGLSYLDNGEVYTHKADSVPDLKRFFLTDYL